MAKRLCAVLAALVLVCTAAYVTAQATSNEKKQPERQQVPPFDPAALAKAAPSEHHSYLDYFAGKWHAKTKFWMVPGQPPEESEGTAKFKWVLGGRFLQGFQQGIGRGVI